MQSMPSPKQYTLPLSTASRGTQPTHRHVWRIQVCTCYAFPPQTCASSQPKLRAVAQISHTDMPGAFRYVHADPSLLCFHGDPVVPLPHHIPFFLPLLQGLLQLTHGHLLLPLLMLCRLPPYPPCLPEPQALGNLRLGICNPVTVLVAMAVRLHWTSEKCRIPLQQPAPEAPLAYIDIWHEC